MPKHLKLRATFLFGGKEAEITILEQTHVDYSFGERGQSFPARVAGVKDNKLYLYGTSLHSRLQYTAVCLNKKYGVTFRIPANLWPELKKLVEAYNEWGATQP